MNNMRKKLSIVVVSLSLIITAFICLYSYKHYHGLKEIDMTQYPVEKNVIVQIDDIKKVNLDYDYIRGWIIKKGVIIKQYNTQLVLFNQNNNKGYVLPLKRLNRVDVTKAMNDNINYDSSGFNAKIDHKYMKNGFRIGFIYNINQKDYLIKTKIKYRYTQGSKQ
jgi:hypothetical protein